MLHNAVSDILAPAQSAVLSTSVWSEPSVTGLGNEQRSIRESRTTQANPNAISSKKTAVVISCVTYITGTTTFLAGVVTIAIPAITVDLQLPSNLVLWYVSAWLHLDE
jgi:hypothetical protein